FAGSADAGDVMAVKKKIVVKTELKGEDTSRATAAVGDQAGHEFMQRGFFYQIKSDDKDFNSIRTENFAQTDSIAGKGTHRGYAVWKTPRGEEIYVHFEGEHHPVDRENTDFSGKVDVRGGTGKFAHITGSGTYRGHITPSEQTSEATIEVSY